MSTPINQLREIAQRCLAGDPLGEELSQWLGRSLQSYLDHTCRSIGEAFDLRFPQGGIPWWREEAIRLRDAALRELVERFYPDGCATAKAREIWTIACRYAASAWRFDRESADMPGHYAGTPKEFLWRAFKSGAAMPIGERQLRNILA